MSEEAILRAIERRLEEYHSRYLSPNPDTVRKWKKAELRRLDRKNQLALPFKWPEEPKQGLLFAEGDSQ